MQELDQILDSTFTGEAAWPIKIRPRGVIEARQSYAMFSSSKTLQEKGVEKGKVRQVLATFLFLAGLLLVLGIAGSMDYADAMR